MCKATQQMIGGKSMKIAVDSIKSDLYDSIYKDSLDISNAVESIRANDGNVSPLTIVVYNNNNLISGVDICKAYKQLSDEGFPGVSEIKVTKKKFNNDDEATMAIIKSHDHTNSSTEDLCRATYAYYESYRKCYTKGHELYLTSKELFKILPKLFGIKRSDDPKKSLSGKSYEDYISVGRKIHELEMQNDYDNLECLLIQLSNVAPSTIRKDVLSQISEWTDEIRAEIRKNSSDSKKYFRRYHANKSTNAEVTHKGVTKEEAMANLYDDSKKVIADDTMIKMVYMDVCSLYETLQMRIDKDYTNISDNGIQLGYEALDTLSQIDKFIRSQFGL